MVKNLGQLPSSGLVLVQDVYQFKRRHADVQQPILAVEDFLTGVLRQQLDVAGPSRTLARKVGFFRT